MIKLRLSNPKEVDILLKLGVKAFSNIVPITRLEKERFIPVKQCFKCHAFDHSANNCPSKVINCSKCANQGHTYKDCKNTEIKCLNCSGNRPRLAPPKKSCTKNTSKRNTTNTTSANYSKQPPLPPTKSHKHTSLIRSSHCNNLTPLHS